MNQQARKGMSKRAQVGERGLSVHVEPQPMRVRNDSEGSHLQVGSIPPFDTYCKGQEQPQRGHIGGTSARNLPRSVEISSAGQTVCRDHPLRSETSLHKTRLTGRLARR